MASTNKTSNLQLSQFIATDTPTWLVDYNGDMEKIDAGVANVQNQSNTTTASVNGINNRLGNANISGIGDGTITGAISEIAKATIVAGNIPPLIKSFTFLI